MLSCIALIVDKIRKEMSYVPEIPPKPRRKKLDVPIHKPNAEQNSSNEKIYKTYSATFNSKRYKQKATELEASRRYTTDFTQPESDRVDRMSRRQLGKENAKLMQDNEDLVAKFNELEDLSVKKIARLKEKITSLQSINSTIVNENNALKNQYNELVNIYEALKSEYEASRICKNCEELAKSLEMCGNENNLLRSCNKEVNEDLNMLKTVVYRLNLQMERYQEKLRRFSLKPSSSLINIHQSMENLAQDDAQVVNTLSDLHVGHQHTPMSWGKVNKHTLGPLLDAYQDTIAEKEEIIHAYETELSNFTGKLKEIIAENETLHSRLTEDDQCSSKLKLELDRVKRELKVTKEHNDILIKKCAMKQDKMDEILKCYEAKVEQLKRDYNVVHDEYCRCKNEITALHEKNRALVVSQDDFKNERQNYIPVSVHTASVNECKKWYEELKVQYENEKRKLRENIETQAKLITELNGKIATISSEKSELENKIKHLKEQIKKHEVQHLELEHSLNEVQLARSACKKQLNKAMTFAKDLVAEQETLLKVLNERHMENKAVRKIGADIATRMDALKTQLKTVQKDAWQELTTVEQRIEEQNNLIESMKLEHSHEIERLKQIIKKQEEETGMVAAGQRSVPLSHYLLLRDRNK